MHNSRLFALVGVGIGIMGLFLKGLSTAGEGLLPTLSQTNVGLPDGIPSIWGGLSGWAQVLLVLMVVAVIVITLRPVHELPLDRTSGAVVAVIGFTMLAFAVAELLEAGDKAQAMEEGFLRAAQADLIPAAYAVSTSAGFVIALVGTVLIVFAGSLSFRTEPEPLLHR